MKDDNRKDRESKKIKPTITSFYDLYLSVVK